MATPNMGLITPTVAVTVGPDWANQLNADLDILDSHTHAAGSGTRITPDAININADLPFNTHSASGLKATTFVAQSSFTTLLSLYVKGVDIYYRDGSNNEIRMTSGGAVNATSSGISSGTNTASFVANVLVVNASSVTPANIQCGSILLGNNIANSKFLTLAPPTAMAANYSLTLPSLPASTKIVICDSAGNLSATYGVDNSTTQISSNNIIVKDGGITKPKLATQTVAVGTTTGSFTGNATSPADITNSPTGALSVNGRPMMVLLQPRRDNASPAHIGVTNGSGFATQSEATIQLYASVNGGAYALLAQFEMNAYLADSTLHKWPGGIAFIDTSGASSSIQYKLQYFVSSSGITFSCVNMTLLAYEL